MPCFTVIVSPAWTSRAGFAAISLTATLPARHASVAKLRVLNKRVAQSHLSRRAAEERDAVLNEEKRKRGFRSAQVKAGRRPALPAAIAQRPAWPPPAPPCSPPAPPAADGGAPAPPSAPGRGGGRPCRYADERKNGGNRVRPFSSSDSVPFVTFCKKPYGLLFLRRRELRPQPIVDQGLFVTQRIVLERRRDPHQEPQVAQIALSLFKDVALRVRHSERELQVGRIDVLHDANVVKARTAPRLEVAGQIDVGERDGKELSLWHEVRGLVHDIVADHIELVASALVVVVHRIVFD